MSHSTLPYGKFCALTVITLFAASFPLSAQNPVPKPIGSEQTFSGLSLVSPASLSKTDDLLGPADNAPRDEITYQGKYDMIQITVSVSSYKADPQEQLDKDIEQFMDGLKKMNGVSEVEYTFRDVTIEGTIAKRVSLNMVRADKVLRGQYLYVVRGSKIWCVQTIYPAKTEQGDVIASAILSSVRVNSSATAALSR